VEIDGSDCLVEAVGQMDHRMHSGEVLPVKGTVVVEVEVALEIPGPSGTGSASQDCAVYQPLRKPGHWGRSGFVKPWTKVVVS
jgi:hypothetical protein